MATRRAGKGAAVTALALSVVVAALKKLKKQRKQNKRYSKDTAKITAAQAREQANKMTGEMNTPNQRQEILKQNGTAARKILKWYGRKLRRGNWGAFSAREERRCGPAHA